MSSLDSTPKRSPILVGAVLLAVALLIGVGLALGPVDRTTNSAAAEAVALDTRQRPTESVTKRSLIEQKEGLGTVGFGNAWSAPIEAQGTVTKRHEEGTTIESGEPLVWVDLKPVFLVNGETPMYRELQLIKDTAGKYQSGDDVTQLQSFLLEEGFDDNGRLEPDGVFGVSTKRAVKEWQKENGLTQSGKVDKSQLIFHPEPMRIGSTLQIGSSFSDLQVTSGAQRMTADFDKDSLPFVPDGGTVVVETSSGASVTGTVAKTETITKDDGARGVRATIELNGSLPDGTERAKVIAERTVADDVLVVPVRAVLALASDGYALEVKTATGTELRQVELGKIVDAMVEVDGDIDEGDEVVVPSDQFGGES